MASEFFIRREIPGPRCRELAGFRAEPSGVCRRSLDMMKDFSPCLDKACMDMPRSDLEAQSHPMQATGRSAAESESQSKKAEFAGKRLIFRQVPDIYSVHELRLRIPARRRGGPCRSNDPALGRWTAPNWR